MHGRAVENGSQKAAVCTDCHGAHEILPANDAKSPINKFNVPATCGKCHADVAERFMQSIHGQAIARGNGLAPVCTDCHGIHTIKAPIDPNSSVSEQNLSRDTCARCHEGVRLSQEFGVPGNRVSTYLDSYHGLASEGGSVVVANCASCHGVHNILPSSDPRSTINRANLDATCGKCHKGVTQKFTLTKVHVDGWRPIHGHRARSRCAGCRWFYLALILLVIGAMFLHNAIIWRSKADRAAQSMQNPSMVRMTREPALAAPDSACQLHRPGDYRLCAQVSRLLVCRAAGHGREAAQHHPPRGRSDPDRRRHLSRLLSRRHQGRPAADSRPCARRRRTPSMPGGRCAITSD